MQRFFAGVLQLHVRLTPEGPWLVRGQTREGRQQGDSNVLMPLTDAKGRLLLPASSLKGVLRATAERILRTLDDRSDGRDRAPLADSPFPRSTEQLALLVGKSPSAEVLKDHAGLRRWLLEQLPRAQIADAELPERYSWEQPPPDVYRQLSAASQLFGSTLHAGLLSLDDATISAAQSRRSHVAIDRFTGGVGEGPFVEALVTEPVPLETTLRVENFALWHLALLGLALRELDNGYTAIGGGTRKGQGRVRASITRIRADYAAQVYGASGATGGLISAQAWLHHWGQGRPWARDDTPLSVITAESRGPDGKTTALLPDLAPRNLGGDDWRYAALLSVEAPEARVGELLRAAVQGPWRAWLAAQSEKGAAYE